MHDDPPREGVDERAIWSGFQTGLRFTDGRRKPSWAAYRLPIVVHTRGRAPGAGLGTRASRRGDARRSRLELRRQRYVDGRAQSGDRRRRLLRDAPAPARSATATARSPASGRSARAARRRRSTDLVPVRRWSPSGATTSQRLKRLGLGAVEAAPGRPPRAPAPAAPPRRPPAPSPRCARASARRRSPARSAPARPRPRRPCARRPRRRRGRSDLSISANSSSTSRSWATFRSGLPWAKIMPSFLAPVMPKSACEASPIPFTAQPSTATSIGCS